MSKESYDLVFKGQLVKSVGKSTAVRNLANLFKIEISKAEALFGGKATILKRNLDFDTASKYRVAIKKAGALVELLPCEAAAIPTAAETSSELGLMDLEDYTSKRLNPGQVRQVAVPDLGLLPVGSNLLSDSEKAKVAAVEVDTSSISLRGSEGNLLDDDEYKTFVAKEVNVDAFEVSPPGADVLKPEERAAVVPVEVDTRQLKVVEQGNLAPAKPSAPPFPDVSKITLVKD